MERRGRECERKTEKMGEEKNRMRQNGMRNERKGRKRKEKMEKQGE